VPAVIAAPAGNRLIFPAKIMKKMVNRLKIRLWQT